MILRIRYLQKFIVVLLFILQTAYADAIQISEISQNGHSYQSLGSAHSIMVPVQPIAGSRLVLFNHDAARRLGITVPSDPNELEKLVLDSFAVQVSETGDRKLMATYYQDSNSKSAGEALGDGRALWLSDLTLGDGTSVDFVLKGVGKTPLAWTNHTEEGHKDGLQSMTEAIHSYIHSEANFRNGIDSTVDIAVIEIPLLKKDKYTGKMEKASITLRAGHQFRVAHLRYHSDNPEHLTQLLEYLWNREFKGKPNAKEFLTRFTHRLAEDAARYTDLIAVHGSPTSGNRTALGGSIDMGTFRYMDGFHKNYSYLFGRLQFAYQNHQMKEYVNDMVSYFVKSGWIQETEYDHFFQEQHNIFDQNYRNLLTSFWLQRMGFSEQQIQTVTVDQKNRLHNILTVMMNRQTTQTFNLGGQTIPASYYDIHHILSVIVATADSPIKKETYRQIVSPKSWQAELSSDSKLIPSSSLDRLLNFLKLVKPNKQVQIDLAELIGVVGEILNSLNLSQSDRKLIENKALNKFQLREPMRSDTFLSDELVIMEQIKSARQGFESLSSMASKAVLKLSGPAKPILKCQYVYSH